MDKATNHTTAHKAATQDGQDATMNTRGTVAMSTSHARLTGGPRAHG